MYNVESMIKLNSYVATHLLRVLYTIIEWLLKSAWQDNCAAALNRFYGF